MSLEASIENLKNSPTFALSSSSKELSHSNFWSWLFSQKSEYVKIFFPFISTIKEINREEGNRDITIWDENGKAFVIENKLKSIPTSEQLAKYRDDLDAKFGSGVLAAPDTPSFTMPYGWVFIPYDYIAKTIDEINNRAPIPNAVVAQYVKDLNDILNIIQEKNRAVGPYMPFNSDYWELEPIKFDDICKKIKANEFCRYLMDNAGIKRLAMAAHSHGFDKLVIRTDYSNKQSIIDVRFVNDDFVIGVQIENEQYRRCVQRNNQIEKDSLFRPYKFQKWFGDYRKEGKCKTIVWDGNLYDTSMADEYCKYQTKDYCFVYQYRNLDKQTGSFEEIAKCIVHDMEEALKVCK